MTEFPFIPARRLGQPRHAGPSSGPQLETPPMSLPHKQSLCAILGERLRSLFPACSDAELLDKFREMLRRLETK